MAAYALRVEGVDLGLMRAAGLGLGLGLGCDMPWA